MHKMTFYIFTKNIHFKHIVVHGGETTSLKKLDNTTLQKPSNMLSYSVGHAAKIGGKKSYSKLSFR